MNRRGQDGSLQQQKYTTLRTHNNTQQHWYTVVAAVEGSFTCDCVKCAVMVQ